MAAATLVLLGGCDIKHRFESAEDRINAAIPLSIETRQAHERHVEQLAQQPAERAALDKTWTARLRVRALTCSPEFMPNWRHSSEDVQAAVKDKACFAEFDRKLQRWMGIQRVRLMLAQPALVAGEAASAPKLLTQGGAFSLPSDAGQTPVLALSTVDGFELIALANGRSLFKEQGTRQDVSLAPNGRLFLQSSTGAMRIRATVGGETLLELPETAAAQWLGTQFLGVRSYRNSKPSYLLDLRSGDDVALPVDIMSSSVKLLPVPGAEMRFNVLKHRGIHQFELGDLDGKAHITLVAEKSGGFDPRLSVMQAGLMSTDGKEWVFGQQKLIRFDPKSLELRETSFEPAQVRGAWPTTKAEQYVLDLFMPGAGGGAESRNGNYIFDSSAGTLARVDGAAGRQPIRYFPAIKRMAQIDQQMIRLSEHLETATPQPVEQVLAAMLDEANRRVLAQTAIETPRMPPQAAPAPAALPADSPLMAQMREAQIEGIGVYEGKEKFMVPGQSRAMGKVTVNVRRSPRPVVLVLNSYEPVQWTVRLEPGARLGAVLVSGYYESIVLGAGEARILRTGKEYAYKMDSEEYSALQRQVQRWTGKPIAVFQGSYQGANFSVGGS